MVLRNGPHGMEGICTLSPISPKGIFPSLHTHRSLWANRPFQPTPPYQSFRCSRWVTQALWFLWIPSILPESSPGTPQPHAAAPHLWGLRGARAAPKRGRPGEGLHPLRGRRRSPFLRRRNPVWGRGMCCPHTAG